MEISILAREIIYYGIVLFFVGYLLYDFTIGDKETPSKKHL